MLTLAGNHAFCSIWIPTLISLSFVDTAAAVLAGVVCANQSLRQCLSMALPDAPVAAISRTKSSLPIDVTADNRA